VRNELLKALTEEIPDIEVNGNGKNQTPHILNIAIPKIDSEYVAMYLDQRGLALSTKSACLERSGVSESLVVAALGKEKWHAVSALRFSFGRDTSIEDVPLIALKVSEAVRAYRSFP
jgi:cysteine desulfurase